jgi:hypothetical protein
MYLPFQSLKIQGFRSISNKELVLEDISGMNFLCGQNNSGKSNILSFVQLLCNHFRNSDGNYRFAPTDFHQGAPRQIKFSLAPNAKMLIESELTKPPQKDFLKMWTGGSAPWFNYVLGENGKAVLDINATVQSEIGRVPAQQWHIFCLMMTNQQMTDVRQAAARVLNLFQPLGFIKVNADLIPALRTTSELKRDGLTMQNNQAQYAGRRYFGGTGTIDLLFHNQHPPVGQEKLLEDFRKVQRFLRYITGNESAEIEIPADKSALIVNIDGKRLPLSNLGTGIEELVIISTAAVNFHNQVVCIEEPELHIHPLLQRKLIEFLQKETDNTYFIATHSPHILDASSASVYHIQLVNGSSEASHCDTGSRRFQICHDLGYQASDLLQANSIIWVEGPSDRIYVSSWLAHSAPELIEGLDFTIMFYGGRLLSHLSADDDLVTDFINLNRLNRNVAVVIDSDKENEEAPINRTKMRIGAELKANGGFEWITQGREIENYLEDGIYLKAVEEMSVVPYSNYNLPFSDRCVFLKDETRRPLNKLKLAKLATGMPPNLDVLDLRTRVNELADFIRKASHKNI